MRPSDEFSYIKGNKPSTDLSTVMRLYYPIIEGKAFTLYAYFVSQFDDGLHLHKWSSALNHLLYGLSDFEESLNRLSALKLITLYHKNHRYFVWLNPPLSSEQFFKVPIYRKLLESRIGEGAVQALLPSLSNDWDDVSKTLSDVFDYAGKTKAIKTVPNDHFDLDAFKTLMAQHQLRFTDETSDVIAIYTLAEQHHMKWYDAFILAKKTAESGFILPKRMIKRLSSQSVGESREELSKEETAILALAKNTDSLSLLEKLKESRDAKVIYDEKKALNKLARQGFLAEIINVMLIYTWNRIDSGNLNIKYLEKLANDYAARKINSAKAAILYHREKENGRAQKGSQAQVSQNRKTNVPKWHNPNYVNKTSEERKQELEKEKAQLLQSLRKGGDKDA